MQRPVVDHCNVVTYITHSWGGAAQYAAKAARQGKSVVNLADIENDALEKRNAGVFALKAPAFHGIIYATNDF